MHVRLSALPLYAFAIARFVSPRRDEHFHDARCAASCHRVTLYDYRQWICNLQILPSCKKRRKTGAKFESNGMLVFSRERFFGTSFVRAANFRNLRRTNDATVSLDDISYCRSTAGYIALITLLVAVCMNFCCTTPSKVGVRYGFVGELASDRNMIAGYDRFYS